MSVLQKRAYYAVGDPPAALFRRYYSEFGDARTILDLGCGHGALGRYRPSSDIEVHGIDNDAGAAAAAAAYELALCLDVDREDLPYPDESFDAVLAKDILEHLHDPARVVRELHRVLRPAGVVVASVVMAKPRAVWADYTHVRGFTQRAARLLFADAGFRVERMWRMGGVPLAERFGFMDAVPTLLRVPGIGWAWASSWELRARKGEL